MPKPKESPHVVARRKLQAELTEALRALSIERKRVAKTAEWVTRLEAEIDVIRLRIDRLNTNYELAGIRVPALEARVADLRSRLALTVSPDKLDLMALVVAAIKRGDPRAASMAQDIISGTTPEAFLKKYQGDSSTQSPPPR